MLLWGCGSSSPSTDLDKMPREEAQKAFAGGEMPEEAKRAMAEGMRKSAEKAQKEAAARGQGASGGAAGGTGQ
jgi:hypothetical protein